MTRYVVVVSESDPVAPLVARHWGTLPSTGEFVDGVPLRRLNDVTLLVRRPGRHVHDERLDLRLPPAVRSDRPVLVFPSVHRSRENVVCLTAHPIGNLGPTAELGGRPRTVAPADARSMTAVLRSLAEAGAKEGLDTTFESTHHGPELELPAFFAEVGYGTAAGPPEPAVRILARVLAEIVPDPRDRVAVGAGGGHYAPHFTDLALHRAWAFGHIVSRHALEGLDAETARAVYRETPEAEGLVYARAADASHPALIGLAPRLRDSDAPARPASGTRGDPTLDARRAGT